MRVIEPRRHSSSASFERKSEHLCAFNLIRRAFRDVSTRIAIFQRHLEGSILHNTCLGERDHIRSLSARSFRDHSKNETKEIDRWTFKDKVRSFHSAQRSPFISVISLKGPTMIVTSNVTKMAFGNFKGFALPDRAPRRDKRTRSHRARSTIGV